MFKLTPHKLDAHQQSNTTASKHPPTHAKLTTQDKTRRQMHVSHQHNRRLRISRLGQIAQSHSFQKQTRDRSCHCPSKSHFLKSTHAKHELKIRAMRDNSINKNTRIILIDWLVEVSLELHISKETLYQSLSYLDRLAAHQQIPKKQYQPLAVGCLWLSHKIDSSLPLSYKVAETFLEGAKNQKWFIQSEVTIVKRLQYRLNPFTLYQEVGMLVCGFEKYFRNELGGAEGWPIQKNRILWICEGVIMEDRCRDFAQSLLAVAIILLVGRGLASLGYIQQKKLLSFCIKLLNLKNLELLDNCAQAISHWANHDCDCLNKFSAKVHHPQLKQLASK